MKNKILQIKVSEEMYDTLKNKASAENMSVAKYCRAVLDDIDDDWISKEKVLFILESIMNKCDARGEKGKSISNFIRSELKELWNDL